ncbi:MAG: antitoxin Xre-like helix-turn-helix domain-containing protein [Polyangiaceae bacterium]|jgi:transcriptional regulator with XRE-family HTH domain
MTAHVSPVPVEDDARAGAVLSRAVLRVAELLGMTQKDLGRTIGLSAASVSRLASGKGPLDPKDKSGELALLLVRIFRSLDALVGGDDTKARAWFQAQNDHVGGIPAERVLSAEGLVHVAQYLDALRGKL